MATVADAPVRSRVYSDGWGRRTRRSLGRFFAQKPLGGASLVVVLVIIFVAAFPALFDRKDPNTLDPLRLLEGPGSDAWLGTDQLGRDLYSRLIHGTRVAVFVGFTSVALATVAGAAVGIISGYYGGRVDLIVQRVVDTVIAFPPLVLAIGVVTAVGPSLRNLVLALAFVLWPSFSRVVRSSVLAVRQMTYVEAAQAVGQTTPWILLRYILPNVAAPILVIATGAVGQAILVESSLSFLGLGPGPPNATWGSMLGIDARFYVTTAWWLAVVPGAAISITVLALNLLGDALRDVLDPRLRGSR